MKNLSEAEYHLPLILDVTSGFRNMWLNKNDPYTLYVDQRTNRQLKEDSESYGKQKNGKGGREYKGVIPTMAADYRFLPFRDETFSHINFDPPHLYRLGKTSLFRKKYGGLEVGVWQLDLHYAAKELWRVLAVRGTLNFKWNDRDIAFDEILRLFPVPPKYGQFGAHGASSSTQWFSFVKANSWKS